MKLNLNQGWFLLEQPLGVTARDAQKVLSQAQGWMEVQLPCDVHMPLLALGRIPEPTEQAHCFASEWIEQRSWWFKRSLFLDAQALSLSGALSGRSGLRGGRLLQRRAPGPA